MRKLLSIVTVPVALCVATSAYSKEKVVVIPLPSAGALAGQVCPAGEFVYGFDASGNILCSSSTKTVFVTEDFFFGDLGGVTGADAKCQTAANNGGLNGTYKAWISVETSSPATSFTQSTVPYVTTRGDQVASNWQDLIDGTLTNPINGDEYGNEVSFADVWTNTKADGTIYSLTKSCENFTSSADYGLGMPVNNALIGFASDVDHRWTESGISFECAIGVMRLYCFQQ